jgi:hypothetical protein
VADGGSITFNLTYVQAPTNVASASSSCGTAKLTWTDGLGETGYRVFRSTSSSGQFVKVSNDLPAGTTTYTDPTTGQAGSAPVGDTQYYYYVQAFNGSLTADSTPPVSVFVIGCRADIGQSSKLIYQVAGIPYTNQPILNGQTVTFRIVISNSNTATDSAVISNILDTMSNNFTNPRNAKVDKGGGFVNTTITGTPPSVAIAVTGVMPPGTNWIVQFDATANIGTGFSSLLRNQAQINCISQSTGQPCTRIPSVSVLQAGSGPGVPQFREVAP